MQRPSWFLAVVLVAAAGIGGLAAGTLSDKPREALDRSSYVIRETLGLEKNWVRVPGPEQAEGLEAVACPAPSHAVVLVTGGQSNAANSNTSMSQIRADAPVFTWFEGRCYPGGDPMLGASGQRGSLWPELGQRLADELGRPVLFINGAIGGTQVGDWLDDRSGYYAALAGRVASARQAGFEPDLILWHQGETDALAEHDMSMLERRFSQLADRLLADMPQSQLYLFQASKCIGSKRAKGVEIVREVQANTVRGRDRAILGMNTDELGDEFRWDTCHFNSLGRAAIVNHLAPELTALLSR
ncbi:sialate O-acetylesterase [Rubellimicrobium roseum]|uniref:Sialate O-acetylesterase n=1 Tax=Rubellimicrobium roseum TaxID=687525 RepID=A0A5C4NLA1_9RHOB|nr:sialate O-acetylesterase [Rubellimicrobium roseum]TNC74770.1 sialate O-acetylesterase [Rubellimicrobium roseum]